MKITPDLIQLLKGFSSINPSINFKKGNVLSTISATKTILAKAHLSEPITHNFAIYDLGKFLSVLSLFDNPSLEFTDKLVTISQGKRKIDFYFSDASLIATPPDKDIKFSNPEVTFSLSQNELSELLKAQSILALPEFTIVGDGEKCYVTASDSRGITADNYSFEVGETLDEFKLIIKADNLKIQPGDYNVEVSSQGLAHFSSGNLEYWVAVEGDSSYQSAN